MEPLMGRRYFTWRTEPPSIVQGGPYEAGGPEFFTRLSRKSRQKLLYMLTSVLQITNGGRFSENRELDRSN